MTSGTLIGVVGEVQRWKGGWGVEGVGFVPFCLIVIHYKKELYAFVYHLQSGKAGPVVLTGKSKLFQKLHGRFIGRPVFCRLQFSLRLFILNATTADHALWVTFIYVRWLCEHKEVK